MNKTYTGNLVDVTGFREKFSTEFGLVRAPDAFSNTSANTPAAGEVWCRVHAFSDTVISAIKFGGVVSSGHAGLTIKGGDSIYGYITEFTASSGTYECYYLHPSFK